MNTKPTQARFTDGHTEDVTVRRLPLSDYDGAAALASDEIALTAFICGHDKAWAGNLEPESYQALFDAAQEANGALTAFVRRRVAAATAEQQAVAAVLASLPPDSVAALADLGKKALASKTPI